MNKQRQVIYEQRRKVLSGQDLWTDIEGMVEETVADIVPDYVDEKGHPEDWDLMSLDDRIYQRFSLRLNLHEKKGEMSAPEIEGAITAAVNSHLRRKEENFGVPLMQYIMTMIMLQSIDAQWKDHLLGMDHLKEGIGLRGYGQKDPVREYQKEGYDMFMAMIQRIKEDTLEKLCLVQIRREEDIEEIQRQAEDDYILSRGEDVSATPVKREKEKVGRNDPCPCGSGKKYKKCCGR
jgi:preprotein translocase subunit SecA